MAKLLGVKIMVRVEESPDLSFLGEYGKSAESKFSIDRKETGDWNHGEYQFFNPNHQNYVGCKEAEIIRYCKQDYDRMEAYNRGDWHMCGIWTEAEVQLTGDTVQRIKSPGLWGVDSDSDGYIEDVAKEEYENLKVELKELGIRRFPAFDTLKMPS